MRRARRTHLGLFLAAALVLGIAVLGAPAGSQDATVGAAGIDTSLPETDSAVTIRGRGRFADLEIKVNQTRNLGNQAVSVTWTGGKPTERGSSRFAANYLQIFQCWGEPDGTVNDNPGPPPEQCVGGATDATTGGRNAGIFPGFTLQRIISRKDFANFEPSAGVLDPRTGLVWRPFRAVGGENVGIHIDPDFNPSIEGGQYWLNPFFNLITTNEIAGGRTRSNGTGAELFEVLTGLESTGLGCGQRVQPVPGGAPKTPRCWLVIVPRGAPIDENVGTPFLENQGVSTSPLAAEPWANRIAIPLEFNPLDTSCDINAADRRITGSELPIAAVGSWQQALCAGGDLPPYSFATVADATARSQLLSSVPGGPGMIVVSQPVPSADVLPTNPVVYAPLSLSGLTIGFNVERTPKLGVDPAEELLRGIRVADINLTPRLVAKLLTQSYKQQTAIKAASPHEWAKDNPASLAADPDFIRFNPEFELLSAVNVKNFGGLIFPSRSSDTARQVWEWVLADPEARVWLGGQPDEAGMRVNPVYATTAASNPTGVPFGDPLPESFPKSDPHCYQGPLVGAQKDVLPPLLCGTDWIPYSQTYRDAARFTRAADDQAKTTEDVFAISPDRVWRPDGPQILGSRAMLAVTDTASASLFGLQMARLSRAGDNDADRRFVAPDQAGLLAGLQSFTTPEGAMVPKPDPLADVAGGYPLTVLSTAAVAPLALDLEAREDYAAFLDYAAEAGQVRGAEPGRLPAGYAPLPAEFRERAKAAAVAVRTLQPVADEPVIPTPESAAPSAEFSAPPLLDFGLGGSVPSPIPVVVINAPPAADGASSSERIGGLAARALTPFTQIGSTRYAVPILGFVSLGSIWGYAEITHRRSRGSTRFARLLSRSRG